MGKQWLRVQVFWPGAKPPALLSGNKQTGLRETCNLFYRTQALAFNLFFSQFLATLESPWSCHWLQRESHRANSCWVYFRGCINTCWFNFRLRFSFIIVRTMYPRYMFLVGATTCVRVTSSKFINLVFVYLTFLRATCLRFDKSVGWRFQFLVGLELTSHQVAPRQTIITYCVKILK